MIDQVAFEVIQEEAPFTTQCLKGMTRACGGEAFFREYEGKRYCVLHLPDADKKETFESAVNKKLESQDFKYQEVWFPNNSRFGGNQIDKPVDFTYAVLNRGVSFSSTNRARFEAYADFWRCTFMGDVSDEVGQPQKPTKALAYSLAVITLQRPDPRPLTTTAWFAVLAETILDPIQAALLILAVRRRFMR